MKKTTLNIVLMACVAVLLIYSLNHIFYGSSDTTQEISVLCIVALLFVQAVFFLQKRRIKKKILRLMEEEKEESVQEFLRTCKKRSESDFAGIYVLCNKTKCKCYVGQSRYVTERIRSHFKGRGNEGVYRDYRKGNSFTIQTLPLEKSGFVSLNKLERYAILAYDAYGRGYNKTRGNRKKK